MATSDLCLAPGLNLCRAETVTIQMNKVKIDRYLVGGIEL